MFRIYADNVCIYNDASPLEEVRLSDPKLVLEDNSAGKLSFVMPVTNRGYNILRPFSTKIVVYKNDKIIFEGRPLTETIDFWNSRSIECEGCLAYLNDSIQPQKEFYEFIPETYLQSILDDHNAQVSEDKQFELGQVTVLTPADEYIRVTDFNTSIDAVRQLLGDESLGGHIEVSYQDGKRYLNYWQDYPRNSNQVISFGKNLIDFTKSFNSEDYCTVCLPRGKQIEDDSQDIFTIYTTVESVNDGNIFVVSETAVNEYGWIAKVVDFEDVEDPLELLEKAREYLSSIQFNKLELEMTALDLSYLDVNIDEINVLDRVRVLSLPHGLDSYFPVKKIELDLSNLGASKYTLGDEVENSYTGSSGTAIAEINKRIENLPTTVTVLELARDTATALLNSAQQGHVHIITDNNGSEEIIISDLDDYMDPSAKIWRWNANGLGYSPTGYYGPYTTAMTMDGQIACELLRAGTVQGLTLIGSRLVADGYKRFIASNYSSSDEEKFIDWIDGVNQPTNEDLLKYDFTQDGKITSDDYTILKKFLQNEIEFYDSHLEIVIEPSVTSDKLISFNNGDYYYGALGLKTRRADIETGIFDLIDATEVTDKTAYAVKNALARMDKASRRGRIRLYGNNSKLFGYLSVISSSTGGGRDSLEIEITCTQPCSTSTGYLIATSDILEALGYNYTNRRILYEEGSGLWQALNVSLSYNLGSAVTFEIEPHLVEVPANTPVEDVPESRVCNIIGGSAYVRSEPKMGKNTIGVVSTGQSFEYLGYEEGGWYKIFYTPKNREGYVYERYVSVSGTPGSSSISGDVTYVDDGTGKQYLQLGLYTSDTEISLISENSRVLFFDGSTIRISLKNVILPDDDMPAEPWWTQDEDILDIDVSTSARQEDYVLEIM